MKLSSEIIVEYLKDDFTFSAAGKITKALTYTRPVFWEESTVPSDGSVYLVETVYPGTGFGRTDPLYPGHHRRLPARLGRSLRPGSDI